MNAARLETSRLFHRFGFGPRPGEYAKALKTGLPITRTSLLTPPAIDNGAASVKAPAIKDLGKRPAQKTVALVEFNIAVTTQIREMTVWWLDRMVASDHGLTERMTWFWHGHWATSIDKVNYALPMYIQNNLLRSNALGNFTSFTKSMLNDCALQYWLDGQDSTPAAPNENLGRELMELFVLGVNRYTEDDVKAISRALTGYQVVLNSGTTVINPKRKDSNPVVLLGKTAAFTGDSLADFLTSRDDCATFISERLWYRFISSMETMPATFSAKNAFNGRSISAAVQAMASDSSMQDPNNSLVKSPVEWFVSACRALEILPSNLETTSQLLNHLNKLGQTPFLPPNVGGWPAAQDWLTSATAQYRLACATWLIKQSSLKALTDIAVEDRVLKSADWLGVAEWSARTQAALRNSLDNPAQFALMALCSPEYIVSA